MTSCTIAIDDVDDVAVRGARAPGYSDTRIQPRDGVGQVGQRDTGKDLPEVSDHRVACMNVPARPARKAQQATVMSDSNLMVISSCPVADHKIAVEGVKIERPYCRMGQDYDCGCVYCSDRAYSAACARAEAWNAATAAHRMRVAAITGALACLALIGRVMGLVASMPGAIRAFACDAATLYHEIPAKGARYRVTGRRGNAKQYQGVVGVCKWIGEADYNRRPANWRGRWEAGKPTVRIGLAVEGEPKLVYVPFGQVERIAETSEEITAKLERKIVEVTLAKAGVRPRWTGKLPARRSKKNPPPMAYVVSGRDHGASGTVFWIGADKRTGEAGVRLGIRCANEMTIWASAYDCRNEPPADTAPMPADERVIVERVAADAVLDDKPELARELLANVK